MYNKMNVQHFYPPRESFASDVAQLRVIELSEGELMPRNPRKKPVGEPGRAPRAPEAPQKNKKGGVRDEKTAVKPGKNTRGTAANNGGAPAQNGAKAARGGRRLPRKPAKQPVREAGKETNFAKNTLVRNEKTANETPRQKQKKQERRKGAPGGKLRIIPLGGLHEIGKNITVIEYGNDMIAVDCGLAFPDEDMLGIDLVIPDVTYLEQNSEKLRGIFLTHGHEDHIGAIPYVLRTVNTPVYGTKLTIGIIKNKLEEHSLPWKADLRTVRAGDTV